MKIIAVIPARLHSTRLPRKLLQDLAGKPVILQTYEAVTKTKLFDEVLVATDADEIAELIQLNGGNVFKSIAEHESGSDRIAEAVANRDFDIIVNVQGDEPFVDYSLLSNLIDAFKLDEAKEIGVVSAMTKLFSTQDIENPNHVKVVTDQHDLALYFSRSPIPFLREGGIKTSYYKHIGIYGFRSQALKTFTKLAPGVLENSEKLEQLRYLENGFKIKMIETEQQSIGIDTLDDLEKARAFLKS